MYVRLLELWMAGNAFCGVIKTFKYMRLSKQLSSLWDILVRASGAMANFGKFASALLRRRCAILHSPHLQNYRCNRSGDQSVHHVRVRAGRDPAREHCGGDDRHDGCDNDRDDERDDERDGDHNDDDVRAQSS